MSTSFEFIGKNSGIFYIIFSWKLIFVSISIKYMASISSTRTKKSNSNNTELISNAFCIFLLLHSGVLCIPLSITMSVWYSFAQTRREEHKNKNSKNKNVYLFQFCINIFSKYAHTKVLFNGFVKYMLYNNNYAYN